MLYTLNCSAELTNGTLTLLVTDPADRRPAVNIVLKVKGSKNKSRMWATPSGLKVIEEIVENGLGTRGLTPDTVKLELSELLSFIDANESWLSETNESLDFVLKLIYVCKLDVSDIKSGLELFNSTKEWLGSQNIEFTEVQDLFIDPESCAATLNSILELNKDVSIEDLVSLNIAHCNLLVAAECTTSVNHCIQLQ